MSNSKKIKNIGSKLKISRYDFSATNYNNEQLPTDKYYVEVANNILPLVSNVLKTDCGAETCRRIAIALACYVEDLVSGTGVWTAFTSLCQKKYKKKLPFYKVGSAGNMFPYNDEMPSFHAVLFLIWYVANDTKPGVFLNPNNPGLRMLAMVLTPTLQTAYDVAPETPGRPMLLPEEEAGIPLFFQIRNLCSWLFNNCYLTRVPDKDKKKLAEAFEVFTSHAFDPTHSMDTEFLNKYAAASFMTMNTPIGPLAIPAYEWLAEIIRLDHEPEEEVYLPLLEGLKSRPYEVYRYETVSDDELVFKDIKGKKLKVSAETMPDGKIPAGVAEGRTGVMSLVLFGDSWVINGVAFQGLKAEVYDTCRKKRLREAKEEKELYRKLLARFGNERIGVCGSYKEYLKLAYGDNAPSKPGDPSLLENLNEAENLLYFLNSDGTVSLLPDQAPYVKVGDNPYYDREEAVQKGVALILNPAMSTPEMRDYIIRKKLIPDAALSSIISEKTGRQLFQRNIRFLNSYTSRNAIPRLMDI